MRSNGRASWYVRLWEFNDDKFWDVSTSALAAAPTLANTFTEVAYNATLDKYRMTIPATLPSGEYAVMLYTSAAALACAAMQIVRWSIRDGIIDAGKNLPIIV